MSAVKILWRGAKAFCTMPRSTFALLVALMLAGLPQFLLVSPAAAEEPTSFNQAGLSVYPEYDDPRLLVMLEGKVPQGTKLPTTVRFLVPSGAEMYSAGSMDAQGRYKGGPPDRKPSDISGWDEISYSLTTNTFRMEYYDDAVRGLPDKTIAYQFRTLYPIDSLDIAVMQPAKATNFNVAPTWQSKGTAEGMTTYNYRYAKVGVDKPLAFDISYTKADAVPSVKPSQQSSSASQGPNQNLLVIAGLGGLALIGFVAIWYNNSRRRYRPAPHRSAPAARRPTAPSRATPPRASVSQSSRRASQRAADRSAFCRSCGAKLDGGAPFCRQCGVRVG